MGYRVDELKKYSNLKFMVIFSEKKKQSARDHKILTSCSNSALPSTARDSDYLPATQKSGRQQQFPQQDDDK